MKQLSFIICLILPLFVNAQTITTYAGGGSSSPGDGGQATAANLSAPYDGLFDKHGNYYFADHYNHRIRKIDLTGIITTVAGTGTGGFSGDGGQATAAQIKIPQAVAMDTAGNLFIVDYGNTRIRKVNAITGIITTIAGTGVVSSTGDGGPATAATLNNPEGICADKQGNLYVCDFLGYRVRKINTSGIISNFAGNGIIGYSGDGCRADTCKIGSPTGLCIDNIGNVYIADNSNSCVFKVNTSGIIKKIAGTVLGSSAYNGDERPATTANISPVRICLDKFNNLFIAEYPNYRVRRVDEWGYIHTVAGDGVSGFTGDGGPATAARFNYPAGISVDTCGNLYIPDNGNNRVRKVTYSKCNYLNVPEAAKATQTAIYPNPATTGLNIKTAVPIESIQITNLLGQAVFTGAGTYIDISYLPNGLYFVKVNNIYVERFIKE